MTDFAERNKEFDKRFRETLKELDEAWAEAKRIASTCTWKNDSDGHGYYWETDCGNAFQVVDGTPKDNGMNYCPYCGKRLVEVIPADEEDED